MSHKTEQKTYKDYVDYQQKFGSLEPRDFTRIHDIDLQELRNVLRLCWLCIKDNPIHTDLAKLVNETLVRDKVETG